ncbi:Calcium-dependent protein kinase 20 [Heracleum sosnowskyi]|uniref:non-specific serine/threonine protein kinase n=1 Tax=Heracleum sosnowskyi TaxID=360622 RepID=A0AAD8J5M5_9APIA|nr:Calcium-dependent protein kinase 20 [Heracleum sosnowskyi]KAK1397319.1 Calcium-dependent protein kinase 20 [Heracleum sosnowskyi]
MGNTCAGPTEAPVGFFQTVSAAVWKPRLPPPDAASAAATNDNKDVNDTSKSPKDSKESSKDSKESSDSEASSKTQSTPPPHVRIEESSSKKAKDEKPKPNNDADKQMKRVASAGLQVASVLQTKSGNLKDFYSLGKKLGQGVMHRDLKPENFLFVGEEEEAALMTIDFGLSVFFKPGETFRDVVGSPYYVAPEVLMKLYGQECDIWSAGVIIYILLSGVPPFWDETEQGIFEQVLKGELDFVSEPWPSISEGAKDLVRKMLVRDRSKRLTTHEVLCHPWVKVDGSAPDKPIDSAVLSRLKRFSAMHKLKKIAIRVIAESLSEEEIAGLKEMFKMIDTDNSGNITLEELQKGLEKVGANLMESEINDLLQSADLDNSGTIDYTEFVAAMLNLNKAQKEDHLVAAFSYFDKDGSGFITADELEQACKQFGLEGAQLEVIMQEVDKDHDGRIDYNEFVDMMQDTGLDMGLQNAKA